jgi:hypothetical protein
MAEIINFDADQKIVHEAESANQRTIHSGGQLALLVRFIGCRTTVHSEKEKKTLRGTYCEPMTCSLAVLIVLHHRSRIVTRFAALTITYETNDGSSTAR